MWEDTGAMFVATNTPSSNTIQDTQCPEITSIGNQCHQGNYVPLRHTLPRIDVQVKVDTGDNIIVSPGRYSTGRGISVISKSTPTGMSLSTPLSSAALLPHK